MQIGFANISRQIYTLSLSLKPKIDQSRQLESGYNRQIYALSLLLEPEIQPRRWIESSKQSKQERQYSEKCNTEI